MKSAVFNELVEAQFEVCRNILFDRGAIYTTGKDRVGNFKDAASLQNILPEEALRGMVTKHIIAIYDFLGNLSIDKETPKEQWEEKITDIINYLMLLKGLLIDNDHWR